MKKSLLLGAALFMAAGAMAQITPGEYYVRSVETGMFLNEGFSWGTLGVTKAYPCAFEVTADGDNYQFKSAYGYIKPDNGEFWMDGNAPIAVSLEKSGEYYAIKIGGAYMTINEEKNYLTDGWLSSLHMCETILYTIKQTAETDGNKSLWEIISREEMVAALSDATPDNPVEASFFLKAGQIEVNASNNISSWKYIKNGKEAEIVLPDGGWFGHNEWFNKTTYAWCINDAADGAVAGTDVVSQEVEGMPAGNYRATYRVVNQNNTPLVVKFNTTDGQPYEFAETDLWYESAQNSLAEHTETAEFTVAEDGKLAIRMEKTIVAEEGTQNRFAFKSFRLEYLGKPGVTGIANIVADENAPVEYFNLQGVRVANPEKGLYIKRQGNAVTKVLVK